MKPKIHTPSPSESSGDLPGPKPSGEPQERTGRKAAGPKRNWLDGSMIGQKFGKLTVVGKGEYCSRKGRDKPYEVTFVPCLCDCGDAVSVSTANIGRGQSCRKCASIKRSDSRKTHGKRGTDMYRIWTHIKTRCFNKNSPRYHQYGGRGITMCERWNSFELFALDIGDRPSKKHSLDRINNDGNYEPGNIRWATAKEQNRNRRCSKRISARGETKTVGEWAEVSPVRYVDIQNRLRRGWSAENAIFTPLKRRFKHFEIFSI